MILPNNYYGETPLAPTSKSRIGFRRRHQLFFSDGRTFPVGLAMNHDEQIYLIGGFNMF